MSTAHTQWTASDQVIKTDRLQGAALAWAVAKAAGRLGARVDPEPRPGTFAIDIGLDEDAGSVMVFDPGRFDYVPFDPVANWEQGGPILDALIEEDFEVKRAAFSARVQVIRVGGAEKTIFGFGSTLLEAACRCFVMHRLGDEVQVPGVLVAQSAASKEQTHQQHRMRSRG